MVSYFIMLNPGHNWVYFKESQKMSLGELSLALLKFETEAEKPEIISIKGVPYVSFKTKEEMSQKDINIISKLSFFYALFKGVNIEDEFYLSPILKANYEYVDPKITTILKYKGKTNELFTKMMVNVALFSSDFNETEEINLLDPISGKGTTLFTGLVNGFNVSGIEFYPKSVQETSNFFKKYLESEKYKHIFSKKRFSDKKKSIKSNIYEFSFARNKEEFKKDKFKKVFLAEGNCSNATRFIKKSSQHIIVGDLPYGIAHGNVSGDKAQGVTRNPIDLIKNSAEAFYTVLKKKGCLVLAFNSFVTPKKEVIKVLESKGFLVLKEAPYDEFEHRVDQAILRDIVVAKK